MRFTYEARVQVPADLLPLMSASNPQQLRPDGCYEFRMDQPIPAYLMALAVGELEFRALSPRTGVYAEPVTLPGAVAEFGDLEKMVVAAEDLYGPYRWERYDLLVLPPSFPFGGMENPRLTFVTPTILAGDRSLTSLVAHELAHSWSGNLVTNATWNDFWLNEGFTVYFERRIMEQLYGRPYADMLQVLGYSGLLHTVQDIGPASPDTHLRLNLAGRDPDEGLTDIAYEKGDYLLLTLEHLVGRPALDTFIKEYFARHAFQSMDTASFITYLHQELLDQHPGLAEKLRLAEWIDGPGIPDNAPPVASARFAAVDAAVEQWQQGTPAAAARYSGLEQPRMGAPVAPAAHRPRGRPINRTGHGFRLHPVGQRRNSGGLAAAYHCRRLRPGRSRAARFSDPGGPAQIPHCPFTKPCWPGPTARRGPAAFTRPPGPITTP